ALDPLVELRRDAPAPRDHLREVPGCLALVAERLAVIAHEVDQVRIGQERLGRDASPVQADAPELVALDAEHPLAKLPCPNRRRAARGTTADHHDVVVVCHVSLVKEDLVRIAHVGWALPPITGLRWWAVPTRQGCQSNIEAGASSRPLSVRRNSA